MAIYTVKWSCTVDAPNANVAAREALMEMPQVGDPDPTAAVFVVVGPGGSVEVDLAQEAACSVCGEKSVQTANMACRKCGKVFCSDCAQGGLTDDDLLCSDCR